MSEHVIDILGVGSREDSYTDLFAYAFKNNNDFKKNFLHLLKQQDLDEWDVKVRPPVVIKANTGRKKDIPDMLLVNKTKSQVLLLENKVFSNEGWEQTERYASDDFKKALSEHLNINDPDIKYYFLSLYGNNACSSKFETIKYSDIAKCVPCNHESSNLNILLRELKERIDELDSWPLPEDNDSVLDYIKKTNRLVNSYRTFTILADNIVKPDLGMRKYTSITSNRGSGYIPLCIWNKDKWNGTEYSDDVPGGSCYEVHFELQWDTRTDWENLTLYLHYHTHPYKTRNEFKETNTYFQSKYNESRNKFFEYLKDHGQGDWIFGKTYLRLAYYTFKEEKLYGEFKNKTNALIHDMVPLIDQYVEKVT